MRELRRMLIGSLRDLTPVALVIVFFQVVVLRQPISELAMLLEGAVLVVLGLTLFVYGLQLALFPIGEALAYGLAERGSFTWLIVLAFVLGFGATIAEPALTAVAAEAAHSAALAGAIASSDAARAGYALTLRLTVALAVGLALVLGVTRIVLGWSLPAIVFGCYLLIMLLSMFTSAGALGIAYDSGGVTTSVITVPLVTALGIGLASSLAGRNPMSDGFGMIIVVILVPIIFVMALDVVVAWI